MLHLIIREAHDEERDTGNEPGCRRNRDAFEILARIRNIGRRNAIEAGKPHRTANQIHTRDEPSDLLVFAKQDATHEQRRSNAKAHHISKRIELATKRRIGPTQTREPPVEQVENTSRKNAPDCGFEMNLTGVERSGADDAGTVHSKRTLQNFQRGEKSAHEISRSHQIREEIDLWRAVVFHSTFEGIAAAGM